MGKRKQTKTRPKNSKLNTPEQPTDTSVVSESISSSAKQLVHVVGNIASKMNTPSDLRAAIIANALCGLLANPSLRIFTSGGKLVFTVEDQDVAQLATIIAEQTIVAEGLRLARPSDGRYGQRSAYLDAAAPIR